MFNNKLSVVYGFDIDSELKYFELSLKSLINSNGTKYKVHTFVKNENLKKEVEKIYLKFNVINKFKVHLLDDIGSFRKQGKFYWLRSPFKVNTKYILQLDNDTLINTNLNKIIINSKKNGKYPIYGVKVKTPANYLESLNEILKLNKKNISKVEVLNSDITWLNAGIILINTELYKKHFVNESNLKKALVDYSVNSDRTNSKTQSDEIFIISQFKRDIGTIARRYNLRFQSPITTINWISKNDFIFHYNLRIKNKEKFYKYDLDTFLFIDKDVLNEKERIYKTLVEIFNYQNDTLFQNNEVNFTISDYIDLTLNGIKDLI